MNRATLSSWMPLVKNADDSLDLYFQTNSPGQDLLLLLLLLIIIYFVLLTITLRHQKHPIPSAADAPFRYPPNGPQIHQKRYRFGTPSGPPSGPLSGPLGGPLGGPGEVTFRTFGGPFRHGFPLIFTLRFLCIFYMVLDRFHVDFGAV